MRTLPPATILKKRIWSIAILLGTAMSGFADVRLPRLFTDHMVLQQEKPIVVWGWAEAGEKITVELGSESQSTQADAEGQWKLSLARRKATSTPTTLRVSGNNKLEFKDVLIGEVWLCSGQSNMEMGVGIVQDGKNEIASANHPLIRLFMVPNRWKPQPQRELESGSWKLCSPDTLGAGGWGGFSAAAYFFGRKLQEDLQVPIGLIDSTWGGTRIESWTPPEGFVEVPALSNESRVVQLGVATSEPHKKRLHGFIGEIESWRSGAIEALEKELVVATPPAFPSELQGPHDLQNPTALYNGMIYPLVPFGIRGAIWYQGESNSDEGKLYTERMRALIAVGGKSGTLPTCHFILYRSRLTTMEEMPNELGRSGTPRPKRPKPFPAQEWRSSMTLAI